MRMCLVHEQAVNAQFLERDHIVSRRIQQLLELGLKRFLGTLHGLNGKALTVGVFQLAYALGYFVNLVLQKPLLPLLGHGDLLKLAVANDYSVVVAGGYAGAEFLTVGLLEAFLRRDEDIRGGIEPEELARPLLGEVVRDNEYGLAAKSEPLGCVLF